jgi:hypothetical protein
MLESTLREQPLRGVHWCVVYDTRNGNVVHTHQFIGDDDYQSDTETRNNRARKVMQVANQHCDLTHLRVIHAPPSFHLEPGTMCRVDLESGELVTLTEPQYSLREFVKQARAKKATKPDVTLHKSRGSARRLQRKRARRKPSSKK